MDCGRFRDTLRDVAAGVPSPAAVEAHLASCEACRTELETLRRALAAADAELAGLVSAEPSPRLLARIRRAVTEPEPSSARRFDWLWPAVAVAATLLVAVVVVRGRGTPPAPGPRVAVDAPRLEPPTSSSLAEPSGRPVIPRDLDRTGPEGSAGAADPSHGDAVAHARSDRTPPRAPSARRRGISEEPEVLVPPGEKEALLRFVALVYRDRLAPGSLAAAGHPATDLTEPALLDIPPLEIVPLDPAENPGT